jgi:LmbE family N-acetylglucosaminyl deacetylase
MSARATFEEKLRDSQLKLSSYPEIRWLDNGLAYLGLRSEAPEFVPGAALAIGAHPDDIELGMAMTVAKLVADERVFYTVCTNGEASRFGIDVRLDEGIAAAKMAGIDGVFFLGLADKLLEKAKVEGLLRESIERVIGTIGVPRSIYTHTTNDRHQDHVALGGMLESIGRYSAELYRYSGPSRLPAFCPNRFVMFKAEDMEFKLELLRNFGSQFESRTINLKDVESFSVNMAMLAIAQNGSERPYAEGFETVKSVKY